MKFTEKLATLLTPEWRNQYINYEELKNMLISAVENAPEDPYDLTAHRSYNAYFDNSFFRRCEEELEKINTFCAQKMAEAHRKFDALESQMKKYVVIADRRRSTARMVLEPLLTKNKLSELKFSYSEFYLSLVLLQNYQTLNHTGFRKILKKHDKLLRSSTGLAWFEDVVESAPFYTNKDISKLIQSTEQIFITHLEGGDRSRAMKRLRVPPLEEQQHPWTTFRLGLFSGVFFALGILILIASRTEPLPLDDYAAGLHLFRGPLFLILFIFLYSLNVVRWRSAGVNHILIFEIEPRLHLKATQIMEIDAAIAVVWALSVLSFIYAAYLQIAPYMCPLTMLLALIVFMFNPLPIWYYSSRVWLLRVLGRIAAAPFYRVSFADFWLGDQLLSMVPCLIDFTYMLCFYATNGNMYAARDPMRCVERQFIVLSIVSCLPAWFRLAQCMRRYHDTKFLLQLVSGVKYATTFPMVIFATLMAYNRDSYDSAFDCPYVWGFFVSATVSSLSFYIYDVVIDFGLFARNSVDHIFLREHIVYSPTFYYFAIVENLLLRFFWIVQFVLLEENMMSPYNVQSLVGCLEIFRFVLMVMVIECSLNYSLRRRFIWNYFLLENEHLNNVGEFRAVRDISVVPVENFHSLPLQHMMDDTEGVTNHPKVTQLSQSDSKTKNA